MTTATITSADATRASELLRGAGLAAVADALISLTNDTLDIRLAPQKDVPVDPTDSLLDGWTLWQDNELDWWLKPAFLNCVVSEKSESLLLGSYHLNDARDEAWKAVGNVYDCDPIHLGWTDTDVERAASDGWLISGNKIERIDDPSAIKDGVEIEPRFASDEDAGLYVGRMAAKGWRLHLKAYNHCIREVEAPPQKKAGDPFRFSQEDLNVRLYVKLGFSVTAGLYGGPLNRKVIAGLIQGQIESAGTVEPFIDTIEIGSLGLDNGTVLVEGCE